MDRRTFIQSAAAGALSMALPACSRSGTQATTASPNVLMIVVDDLKPLMGCYGNPLAHTPHMDSLARRGVTLDRAYCQMAICHPSRVSVLTGCRPDTTQITNLKVPLRQTMPNAVTVSQHFAQAGYKTVKIGKVDHINDPIAWQQIIPNKRGSYASSEVLSAMKAHEQDGLAKGMTGRKLRKYMQRHVRPSVESPQVADNAYKDGDNAVRAAQFIHAHRNEGQPYFFAVGFSKPHLPFACPKKYWDMYDRDKLPATEIFSEIFSGHTIISELSCRMVQY